MSNLANKSKKKKNLTLSLNIGNFLFGVLWAYWGMTDNTQLKCCFYILNQVKWSKVLFGLFMDKENCPGQILPQNFSNLYV